jgi:hypothetical protein
MGSLWIGNATDRKSNRHDELIAHTTNGQRNSSQQAKVFSRFVERIRGF